MNCEFCNKTFSSISSLNKHKNTTKYCLKLQGKDKIEKKIISCEYCDKTFILEDTLQKHISICKVKELSEENLKQTENLKMLEEQLQIKDIEIAELKASLKIYKESDECLKEIAKQPKNTNNTTKNNSNLLYMPTFNIDKEDMKNKIKNNFTKGHLKDGQFGVASFTVDNLLKDEDNNYMYVCTDPSRHMFSFKNKDGTIEKDFKANKLTKLISEDVIKQATTLTDDKIETNIKLSEIRELKKDNSKFTTKLSNLLYKPGGITLKYLSENESVEDNDSEEENYITPEPDIEYYHEQLKKINEIDDGVSAIYSMLRKQVEEKIEEKSKIIS
jgi:hypothetical protein